MGFWCPCHRLVRFFYSILVLFACVKAHGYGASKEVALSSFHRGDTIVVKRRSFLGRDSNLAHQLQLAQTFVLLVNSCREEQIERETRTVMAQATFLQQAHGGQFIPSKN